MPNESDEFDELLEKLKNFRPNVGSLKPRKEQLVDSSDPSSNDGEKEVSILFANLYGAERLTQQMEVETRVELFDHYFGVSAKIRVYPPSRSTFSPRGCNSKTVA